MDSSLRAGTGVGWRGKPAQLVNIAVLDGEAVIVVVVVVVCGVGVIVAVTHETLVVASVVGVGCAL